MEIYQHRMVAWKEISPPILEILISAGTEFNSQDLFTVPNVDANMTDIPYFQYLEHKISSLAAAVLQDLLKYLMKEGWVNRR